MTDTPQDGLDAPKIKEKRSDLSFSRTLLYSLGSGAGLFLYNTFNTFIQFFYVTEIGLPAQWVGRGLFAFGFWNAVNDPIVGWIADSKKSAMGRRKWFIRTIAIPVAVAFMAVWIPPFNVQEHGLLTVFVYFLIIISVYDVLQSLITLNVDALLPEMFQEANARLNAAVTVTVIGSVFGGIAVAIAPLVYGNFGWTALGVVWGIFAACLYFASLPGIHEDPMYAEAEEASIGERLRLIFQNRTFLVVILMNTTYRMILAALVASLPFFAEYVLLVGAASTTQLVIAFVLAYTIAMIIWQPVFKRIGTRNALLLSVILFSASSLPILFVDTLTQSMLVIALIGFGISGPSLVGLNIIFADVVDEDYVKTGVRREGMYRGLLGFVFRWPPAFAALIIGELLRISGFDANIDPISQPEAVANSIRSFVAYTPFIFALITAVILYFYPLHGERLHEVQRGVQIRNEELEDKNS